MSVATLPTRLMNAQEVSELLGVRLHRVYQLARENRIPVVRIGRQIRVRPEALEDWLDAGGDPLEG